MISRKFDTKFLKDELGLPSDAIEDTITETDRWSEHHDIIFEHEGLFYCTGYSCGATEMQYQSPWDDEDTVDCLQVEKKEVLVEQWVTVEE
jgi:hypothetical protein